MSQSEASDDMDGWITRYADISKTIDEDTEIPESEKARLKDLLDKQQVPLFFIEPRGFQSGLVCLMDTTTVVVGLNNLSPLF